MLKFVAYRFSAIAAVMLSALLIFISVPDTAQAEPTVPLDGTGDLVNVVTVYPTTPNAQSKVIAEVSQAEASTFSTVPGFQDAAILKAQDGTQVIAFSQWQWQDLSSFQSYEKAYVLDTSTDQPSKTFACQVQHTETRTTSPSLEKGNVIMFSQFKMKPDKEQSELATIIGQMMPGVLQMIPGLQWAAMCPSTNQSTIALLARWNSRADFESLGQKPGFEQETNYWQDYANNEHGLYDVIEVIR